MAQQPQVQKQLFHYENVQILKDKCLGIGSYGAVYKAKCGELFCAAKILHPTLVPCGRRNKITDKFEQECNFLASIRHPNIVLCLGVTTDPESGLKVLLMELMDESLTTFLEQSEKPLPYHIQVNLCHDIVLALAFLHSNGIIHRDLSSNNVLLIAGSRAKITDFGMSRLANIGPDMTQCPGTQVYMPPEALKVRPVYTQKLDCFSFGVVGLQIMTGLFPEPSDSERIVEDSKFRTGTLKVLVPELERRKDHVNLIDPNYPLLAVVLDCLKDKENERPASQELCHHLSSLKEYPQYIESERYSKELTMGSMVKRERQIKEQYEQQLQLHRSAAEAEILQVKEELQNRTRQVQEQKVQLLAQQHRIENLNHRIQILQQSQFQRPTKQLVDSTGNSHLSPSWHQVPQQAIPHRQYPSSPQVLTPLQSHDPSTGSELNPVIDHKNLHRLAQGVPTGQSPTTQHKQCSPQEVKAVQTPDATPVKVRTSVSSRSFQEQLHNLFQQFPDLVESQDEGPAPSTSDPTYQNIGDVLQSEGETEKPQESLAPDTHNFPEPVVQSEAELEQLERYRQNQSGLMSINPGIKDARSIIDDDGVGPCYGSLSPPDRSLAHTPSAQNQQHINEAWTVRTEAHTCDAEKPKSTQHKPMRTGMPNPKDLLVGQADLADPVVEGFWFCQYCTNLVSNTFRVCDVCGGDKDAMY